MHLKKVSRYLLFSSLIMNSAIFAVKAPSVSLPSVKKEKKAVNESKKALVAKIGIVDIRRIITQNPAALDEASHEWKDLFNKIQDLLKGPQKELADLEASYKRRIEEFEKLRTSGVTSKEALMRKYQEEVAPLEYQLQAMDQQLQQTTYRELTKAQNAVGPKIDTAIDEVVKNQGWDFVIIRDSVLSKNYCKDFEITDDVLTLLNRSYAVEKAKVTVKAQPA